ncbi:MAG: ROK family protein, partial [Opitutaceae bacterium]
DFAAEFRLASAGDPCSLAIRSHSLLVWSTLVVNLIVSYDPERVIIGGGITDSAAVILPEIQAYVDRHAHTPWGRVRVLRTELGDAAALMAGGWLLREQFPDILM